MSPARKTPSTKTTAPAVEEPAPVEQPPPAVEEPAPVEQPPPAVEQESAVATTTTMTSARAALDERYTHHRDRVVGVGGPAVDGGGRLVVDTGGRVVTLDAEGAAQ